MNNIKAVLEKQIKDTLKNKTILIQFVMFPALTLIMENLVQIENMPNHFFAKLFSVMYVGMAPLTCMAAILAEEKEQNTLRVLLMSNVKPWEYLMGTGFYIWAICMAGACIFALCGEYAGMSLILFLLTMSVGIITSIILGAAIGTHSKNQMTATSITLPVMMLLSFLPMLSMFNTNIRRAASAFYTQQISMLLQQTDMSWSLKGAGVVLINILIAAVFFICAYRRCGLE